MSGPSDKAVEAAVRECARLLCDDIDGNDAAKEAGRAMHDPALDLDASVCKRDVIRAVVEALRKRGDDKAMAGTYWLPHAPADFIEREFGAHHGQRGSR